jgi:ribosomal protein S17E
LKLPRQKLQALSAKQIRGKGTGGVTKMVEQKKRKKERKEIKQQKLTQDL